MPHEATTTSPSGLDIKKLLLELEVPFSPEQVQWRVTNTTNLSGHPLGRIVGYSSIIQLFRKGEIRATSRTWKNYSYLSAIIGSTRIARRAGI